MKDIEVLGEQENWRQIQVNNIWYFLRNSADNGRGFLLMLRKKIWVNFKRMLKYMMNSGIQLDECSIINWMKINS